MKKVDLYARSVNGEWVLIFKDINEDEASKICEAGFRMVKIDSPSKMMKIAEFVR